jgi:hypothetical protein
MSDFMLGFALCYAMGALLEYRVSRKFSETQLVPIPVIQSVLISLTWPLCHFLMAED